MLTLTVRHPLKEFELDISLQAGPELLALFGPSGAGKSMTLQMIAGLVRPKAGRTDREPYARLDPTGRFCRSGASSGRQRPQVAVSPLVLNTSTYPFEPGRAVLYPAL